MGNGREIGRTQREVLAIARRSSVGGWKRAAPCARPTGFMPSVGDAFPILTYASRGGAFGSVTGTTAGLRTFTPGYNATNLTLNVT